MNIKIIEPWKLSGLKIGTVGLLISILGLVILIAGFEPAGRTMIYAGISIGFIGVAVHI